MVSTYCYFRSKLFHHMAQDHSFNLGNPDNIGRGIIFSLFLDSPSTSLWQSPAISGASAHPSILPYIHLSICSFACFSVSLFTLLPFHLSVYQSVWLSDFVSIHPHGWPSVTLICQNWNIRLFYF